MICDKQKAGHKQYRRYDCILFLNVCLVCVMSVEMSGGMFRDYLSSGLYIYIYVYMYIFIIYTHILLYYMYYIHKY